MRTFVALIAASVAVSPSSSVSEELMKTYKDASLCEVYYLALQGTLEALQETPTTDSNRDKLASAHSNIIIHAKAMTVKWDRLRKAIKRSRTETADDLDEISSAVRAEISEKKSIEVFSSMLIRTIACDAQFASSGKK